MLKFIKKTIREAFKIRFLENILVNFTQNKPNSSLYVKLLPANADYKNPTWRTVKREGIFYKLDICDYMDYTLYYGIQN